jgi:TRAP transporter 4TM/12TM fusion protein
MSKNRQDATTNCEEFSIPKRELTGFWTRLITVVGVVASIFHIYAGGFAAVSTMDHRVIHLGLLLPLVFLIYAPSTRHRNRITWFDLVLAGLAVAASVYILVNWRAQMARIAPPSSIEIILGCAFILVILEAARRTTGLALAGTATIFLAFALFGPHFPGFLAHKGYSIPRLTSFLVMTGEGIFGTAMGVSATYVVLFVLFGSFLNALGGSRIFMDLAYSLTGRYRGGPAKTAIVSSAMMGTVSGSAIANVVTTGTFTIPLMKSTGYSPDFAGAVEAVASTGGMIMPPVMGAGAFIMAQYLGVPYVKVAYAAAIPALLYYLCIFFIVDMEAEKKGLVGVSPEQLPGFLDSLKKSGVMLLPIGLLVFLILRGMSPTQSVVYSVMLALAVSMISPATRPNMKTILAALEDGARSSISVAVSCACAGLIVGVISLTGIGVRFSSSLIELSRGSLFLALVYSAIASIILGMGMPATAVYIIQAVLNVPALIKLGVAPLAAHMFIFYFSCIGCITPPVALTAYAAAGVSGGNPTRTGWLAFWLGIVAYVVPFMFVYSSTLLMQGAPLEVIIAFITAVVGTYFLACGIEGLFLIRRGWIERVLLFGAGLLLIHPGTVTDVAAIPLVLIVVVIGYFRQRTAQTEAVKGAGNRL